MLPTILVTLSTFLLELCNSSPVYNMQPAFITNTLGATTGRNIRNLPCISRRNNNQHGVCMFAIDCLKANGTHLGTCIDRFYFGSCCHIEPVHEIIDNTIESDIIPAREPPYRITSTTVSSTVPYSEETSLVSNNNIGSQGTTMLSFTTKDKIISSTSTTTDILLEQSTKASLVSLNKTSQTSTVTTTTNLTTVEPPVEKLSTSFSVEITTLPEKLQTFQVVDGNTLEEITTKPTTTTIKSTKVPTTISTPVATPSKPITAKPTQIKTTTKPVTRKPTSKITTRTTTKPKLTTTKPKPVRTTATASTPKPIKTTRPATVKPTQKPTKGTQKPVRTTTARPVRTTTKKGPTQSTKSPTKKPAVTPKPTKKVPVTVKPSTTTKITTTVTTTTSTPLPTKTTVQTTAKITEPSVTKPSTISTTTVSNEISITKVNLTQVLQNVSGNPVTNEIETAKPIAPLITTKPTSTPPASTWTVADNKNYTGSPSTEIPLNTTTEDWVPITTPDGWVLLPNVPPVIAEPETTLSSQIPVTTIASTQQPSSSTITSTVSTTVTTEGKPAVTDTPITLDTTTQQMTPVTNMTIEKETETPLANVTVSMISTTEASMNTSDIMRPVNMSDFTDVCGRRMYPEARIVGGEKSSYGRWPWQLSLRQWRTSTYLHKCGAALLNENWAITAAHCVDNVPPSDLLLRLGEHDLSTDAEPYMHQERRVQIVASHPQFDPRTFEYDLALLRFYEPVTFQPNILPVCVPQSDENFVGRTAHVTGWGRLYEDGPLPSILQEVSVPVINNSVCESMYRSAGYIEDIPHIFICAGWRRGGFDSCEGDSGGPMVIQREDKRFLLAGVISWGIGCAEPNQPGVYTRISEFRDWINQILQF